jgi:hypothetical protein
METAVVSVICIALIVFGGMAMSQGFLTSVDTTTTGLAEVTTRGKEIIRTELDVENATSNSSGGTDITLRNSGQTKLADFSKWDVIIHYYDDLDEYRVVWLPYTSGTPGGGEWTVAGIYLDTDAATPEAYEPGILNPGEEIVLRAQLDPPAKSASAVMTVVATPNGVPASYSFQR